MSALVTRQRETASPIWAKESGSERSADPECYSRSACGGMAQMRVDSFQSQVRMTFRIGFQMSPVRKGNCCAVLFGVVVLLLGGFLPMSNAQNRAVTDTSGNEVSSGSPPSADQVIALLQDHPDLLNQVKKIDVRYLQQQGERVPDGNISDETLFARIQEDADFRGKLIQGLREQGYFASAGATQDGSDSSPGAVDSSPSIGSDSATDDVHALDSKPSIHESPRLRRAEPSNPDQNAPVGNQKKVPYADLPSLRDLYLQLPAQSGPVQRFGIDIFRNRTGHFDNFPSDLPVGPDYVLGAGDGLTIDLWGGVSQHLTRNIDRTGRVALPEAGSVVVIGKTLADAQKLMQDALTPQFHNIRVDLSLARVRTVRVYVIGDVVRSGAYDLNSLSTPLNALYAAGGPTDRGSLRRLQHFRGDHLIREVDLYDILIRGVRTDTERLESGDTILVPPVGPQVTISGMVHRPAIYELRDEKQLADVIDLAGGVLVSANLQQVNIERIQAHEQRIMVSLNLPDTNDMEALRKALGAFGAQDGDQVTIAPILPYSNQTIYVQGHVFRPGKYPFHKGMDIGDVIRSYKDILPEPADHAEIIRLQPPDYRPVAIEFKLGEVLDNTDPIELQPFDTIRIFGRYEIDAPKVSIYGEVLRPGEYPLPQNMTASALVRMAGGFKRSALTSTADITSYVIENNQRILTKHSTIDISKALEGDALADVTLKPGDTLTIRQLTGWGDIGASIAVNGEVRYSGTYGIQEGERLSSIIRRSGGFRSTAYPEGAILERVEVRDLEEKDRNKLIQKIESAGTTLSFSPTSSSQDQASMLQTMMQQKQQIVTNLRTQPVVGRLVIGITSNIDEWQNTFADIELRPGDKLTIPKRPNFVFVGGQVYNSTAVTYVPGKTAAWYLKQAGGPTEFANKGSIFIVRANASVIAGSGTGSGLWKTSVLSTRMRPGDSLVVPEKIVGGSPVWKNLLSTAQFTSALAITARVATTF
jgi:polysaccharide biosynthesis/export protein